MNRIGVLILGAVIAVPSLSFGQDSASADAPVTRAAIGHGSFPVKVIKTLDSSKLKEDETVEVETAGAFKLPDGTLVPKGSILAGRVTAAKARSNGDPESQLAITFNSLNLAKGKQFSLKGKVQAVFPPADEMETNMTGGAYASSGGAVSGASVGTVTDAKAGSNLNMTTTARPVMTPESVGVQGMNDLELDHGVLSSKGKNVKLGRGVQMVVHAYIFG
jgi:hypothetical protein